MVLPANCLQHADGSHQHWSPCHPLGPHILGRLSACDLILPRSSCYVLSVRRSVMSDSFATPMDCSPPGPSVHGILQARTLEWVAMPSSRGIFLPRTVGLLHCRQIHYHLSYQETQSYPPHLSIPLQCLLEASVTYWVLAFGDLSNYSVLLFSRHGLLYLYFPTDPITMLAQFSKE